MFAPCKQCFTPFRVSVDCFAKSKLLAAGTTGAGGVVCICMVQLPHAEWKYSTEVRSWASEKSYFDINFFFLKDTILHRSETDSTFHQLCLFHNCPWKPELTGTIWLMYSSDIFAIPIGAISGSCQGCPVRGAGCVRHNSRCRWQCEWRPLGFCHLHVHCLALARWLHNHTIEFHLCFLHLPQLHESRWWNSLEKRSSLWERVHLVQERCSLTRLFYLTMGSVPRSEEYLAKEALQEAFTVALLL